MENPGSEFILEKHISKNVRINPLQIEDTYEYGLVLSVKLMKFGYLALYIHSVLAEIKRIQSRTPGRKAITVVFGTGGDDFSKEAAQIVLQTCAANYVNNIETGPAAVLGLPLISLLLKRSADITVGFYLGYSEYRGESDVQYYAVKCLVDDGRFMTPEYKERINTKFKTLKSYKIVPKIDSQFEFDELYTVDNKSVVLKIVNPVNEYLTHIEGMFDFNKLHYLFAGDIGREPYTLLIDCNFGKIIFGEPLISRNLEQNCWFIKSKLEERNCHLGVTYNAEGTVCLVFGAWAVPFSAAEIIGLLSLQLDCVPFFQVNPAKDIACSYTSYNILKKPKPGSVSTVYDIYPDLDHAIELLANDTITLYGDSDLGIMTKALMVPDGIWLLLALLSVLQRTKKPLMHLYVISRKYFQQAYEARLYYNDVKPDKAKRLMAHLSELCEPEWDLVNRKFGAPPFQFIVTSVTTVMQGKLATRISFDDGSRIAYKVAMKSNVGYEVTIFVAYKQRFKKGVYKNICDGIITLSLIATRVAAMKYFAGMPSYKYYF